MAGEVGRTGLSATGLGGGRGRGGEVLVGEQLDAAIAAHLLDPGAGVGLGDAGAVFGDVLVTFVADVAHLVRVYAGMFDDEIVAGGELLEELDEVFFLGPGGDLVPAPSAGGAGDVGFHAQAKLLAELRRDRLELGGGGGGAH